MDSTPQHFAARLNGEAPGGRRILDLAEGILIGLRRYETDAAFAELLDVARSNGVTVSAAAASLVQLASTNPEPSQSDSPFDQVLRSEWRDHLRDRATHRLGRRSDWGGACALDQPT